MFLKSYGLFLRQPVILVSLFLLFCFLYSYDFPALVEATIRTDNVLEDHCATISTGHQIGGFKGIVGAPAVSTAFGEFTLWLWGHSYSF
jgi:hypothetical protein